jgi:hypothetical protein
MPSKSRHPRKSEPTTSEAIAVPDFGGEEEADKAVNDFDRVMRGLVQVPKSELDAALRKERSRKRRGHSRR